MRKLFLLTGCVWTMLFTACDNTDYSDHSPFDNSAYLSVAEIRNVESFTFNRRVTEQTKKFYRQADLSGWGGRNRPLTDKPFSGRCVQCKE